MNQGLCLKLLLLNLTLQSGIADNWTQFRGQNGTGISKELNLTEHPVTGRDIAWKIDLPGRGLSSPIIIENRAFVTCSSGIHQDRLHVICYNTENGEEIWHRQFWATGRTMTQQKTCVAASTPTSDGARIFALFSSNDLICLDLNGNLKWLRGLTVDYPNAGNSLGMASSPIIAENTLIIQTEADSESLALGIDPETGLNLWKRERPRNANWTSPLTLKTTGGSSIIALQSSRGIEAIHPKTGIVVWSYDDGAATIPSSASNGEILFVPSHGITALKLQPGADSFTQIWRKRQFNPGTASPIAIANRIYTVNNAGVLTCGDCENGKRLWQLRLKGPFTASPVGGRNHLYFVNEKGLLQVVNISAPEGKLVATYDFKDTILATPSIADNALFVRSDRSLWKLTE